MASDFTHFDDLNQMVSAEIERITQYNMDKEESEDIIEAMIDMLIQTIAYSSILYVTVKALEERLNDVPQDS